MGEYEKVQGGYGKYQGIWIFFECGFEVCCQYGVYEVFYVFFIYKWG